MKLHCQIFSSGNLEEINQPPIIFLHAMGFTGNVFQKVAPIISKNTKRKVYVPDVRNHGKSPWSNEMTYDVLTNDLLEFMQQNNIPKAILIGSSMGGRIAINFALKYPHKVDALIVEDMTPRNVVSSGASVVQSLREFVLGFMNAFSSETDLNEAKKNLFELVMNFFPFFRDKKKVIECYFPDFVPLVKEGDRIKLDYNIDALISMLDNEALVQNLPDLNVTFNGDALFIFGSKGFFKLDKDPSVKKLFPTALIRKVENASHFVHFDSPEEYTRIITDFILNRNLPQSKY